MDKTPIQKVYEKYRHFDPILSDEEWLDGNLRGQVLYDLWGAIKACLSADKEAIGSTPGKTETKKGGWNHEV